MGLADLHIHTTYSYDGTSSVSGVLKYAAHHTRLDIIAITDHNQVYGALEAVEMAPSYGIEVIPGVEISSAEGHVLALFVTQTPPTGLSLEKTVLRTMELGGLCIIPHPMINSRLGVHPGAIRRALADPLVAKGLVGVEVFNTGTASVQSNGRALALCKTLPLAQVGSSDAHMDWVIGLGVTRFPGKSIADLHRALLMRQTEAIGIRPINRSDFFIRYIPRLVLRHAGWVTYNIAPSEPSRLLWRGYQRARRSTIRRQAGA